MCYEVSGFIDCIRFKSIFTKPTFIFHDSVNVMLASIPELFLCLILSSMRPWNLKSFFFSFFFTGTEFYSHELVEWKAVVWYCASESFHWRKESCHMVYQGSASADVSLGRCHGFKVASILSDSHGERITAAAEIIVRDLSRHQCVYIQHIQKHTPNIHVCTFKYGWGSWMRSFEFRIEIPRLPFNDRTVSWCFLLKNETYSPLCYFLFP